MARKMIIAFYIILLLSFPLIALARALPDTGQTKCYDDAGTEITCPQPGETFHGQDANYTINPHSFTKLDAEGKDLPDEPTEWIMVRDNVTDLIWEVKTDDGSVHDKDNKYTWRVHFYNGIDYNGHKSYSYYVRAVRGGQNWLFGHFIISAQKQASTWYVGESMLIAWETKEISGNVKMAISNR